ncbi:MULTISPECIES: ABC transporter permease [unclassified Leucobacter]|uniref:ABC transporter permease n=1 Tax=unclassified Leucobacter TaxID=2621730 RepID=UPI00165E620E|nr:MULTISPECIES: ABC transporter permease [unclassified Leucobacter]MBC9936017.1 ABC transporter permease [Leucobacter sp. cx-87]
MSLTTSKRPGRGHPVARMLAARTLGAIALLVALSLLVFSLMYLAPGDLVQSLLGPKKVSPETVAALRAQYRLDDPFLLQYAHWLGNAVQGDFGTSIRYQQPVSLVISQRAGATLMLALLAFLISVVVSVPLGMFAARRPGGPLDRLITSTAVIGVSAPAFAVSLLLILVFSYRLDWFPLYGFGSGGLDTLWHLTLPAIALVIGLSAILTKITRTALVREYSHDSITFARARGLSQRKINLLALRGAATPIVTGGGLVLTSLVGGAIFVETVFAFPGLGTLLQDSVIFKDVPVVQAVTLLIALFIVAVAVIVDLVSIALDPRLRRRDAA